jgi:hypothetical protein
LTTAAAAGFAAIQLMLGVHTTVSLLVLREIFIQGLLAVLLTIPIYPLIRRALRPALIDDLAVLGARSPITRGLARAGRARGRRIRRAAGYSS